MGGCGEENNLVKGRMSKVAERALTSFVEMVGCIYRAISKRYTQETSELKTFGKRWYCNWSERRERSSFSGTRVENRVRVAALDRFSLIRAGI